MSKNNLVADYKKIARRQKRNKDFSSIAPKNAVSQAPEILLAEDETIDTLGNTLVDEVREFAEGRKLLIGVFARTKAKIALPLLNAGHSVVMISDRFGALYRTDRLVLTVDPERDRFRALESTPINLPIAQRSLDVAILVGGIPALASTEESFRQFVSYLKPKGLLLWPHPVTNGFRGAFSKVAHKLRKRVLPPEARERLTGIAMRSGLKKIKQLKVKTHSPALWFVTAGELGKRPWEKFASRF